MFIRTQVDRVVDPLDHVRAVAGQQRGDVDVSLLQIFVGVKLVGGALQLAVGGLVARYLRANKSCAQPVELILNFLASGFERGGQRGIDRVEFTF